MFGNIIGALGSLVGGLFGREAHKDAQAQQMQIANQNIQLQKDFAQSGIQWRVADAEKAGVHPLFALGAQTHSFSPISVGGQADTSLATAASSMGQDIGRAIDAGQNPTGKLQARMNALQVQRAELENAKLQSEINRMNQQATPGMPANNWLIPGQGQTGIPNLVTENPMSRTVTAPGAPHSEPGAVPDIGWARTGTGGLAPIPSKDVKEKIEDMLIQEFMWTARNNLLPSILPSSMVAKPPTAPAPGMEWYYNIGLQEWRQRKPWAWHTNNPAPVARPARPWVSTWDWKGR